MSIQSITTKIISTLGNKDSLIPIMIKDGVDSTSLTYKSFKEGGPIEGIDRAIDEYGTQAIWIGGIPFYKKLIDLSAYKLAKLSPDVDPRIIANKEYAKWAQDSAKGFINKKGLTVEKALSDCLKDGGKLAKNLYKGKIIAATALTLITYFLLTKTKQKNTENNVKNELKNVKKHETKPTQGATPSFKGMGQSLADAIMFNPVHNMKIIDAGITTERLACSRNKTEFCEHAIKEGVFLFFVYGFGNLIESGINKMSDKLFNKPIDLKIDVLMDKSLKDALKNGTIASDLAKMPTVDSLTDKLNFVVNNPDNILVKAAKKSDIIKTVKDSAGNSVIDTSKYIDIKELDNLKNNLLNFNTKYKLSNDTINGFLNKAKGLKVASVLANIGISCFVLGYIIPKLIYEFREKKTGSTKFHVAEDIKNDNKKDILC